MRRLVLQPITRRQMPKIKINELDVLDLRRVTFCPSHFSTTNIERRYNIENAICTWIDNNLSGRYYFGANVSLNKERNIETVYTVGFEQPKEMSFFMLACPHLKYQ